VLRILRDHPDELPVREHAPLKCLALHELKRRISIQCGRHQLVSKPLVGNYPSYKQVIPAYADQLAVIPHDRKPGLIAWLRSLEIGSTLCLSDELSPGICRHPTGRFCVIMPMRVTIPPGANATTAETQPQHMRAA
jgi:hypothetical protein